MTRLRSSSWLRVGLLLLAPLLLLIFVRYIVAPTDSDYWWHIRTGQYIVETGTVPRSDFFSYTVSGQTWVTHEWLTEVGMYFVQEHLGYVGNVLLFGALSAPAALAVYATCRLRGLGEPTAALLMSWAATMTLASAGVRAQTWTMFLLAVFALILTQYKQGQTRMIWLLPLLVGIWANLHAGYLIGPVLVGLTVVGEAVARVLHRPSAPLRPLLLVLLLSIAAPLFSPHGFEALLYPFSYLGNDNSMMRYIAEWQSPNFHLPYFLIFAASLLAAIALGLGRRPLGPSELLWGLALALMGLQSVRHIALFGIVVVPLIGARLQAEVPTLGRSLANWERPRLLIVLWPVMAIVALSLVLPAQAAGNLQLGPEPSTATYPVGAVDYLRTHDVPGNLFNSYAWGGYLIDQLYPDRPVFIDGRTDVYANFVQRYEQVTLLQPGWRDILAQYDVRLVLVEKDSALAVVLADDPGWQEAYTGDVEQLFVRN
jgi:hypothetical protein